MVGISATTRMRNIPLKLCIRRTCAILFLFRDPTNLEFTGKKYTTAHPKSSINSRGFPDLFCCLPLTLPILQPIKLKRSVIVVILTPIFFLQSQYKRIIPAPTNVLFAPRSVTLELDAAVAAAAAAATASTPNYQRRPSRAFANFLAWDSVTQF